jgi:hypothetical protein
VTWRKTAEHNSPASGPLPTADIDEPLRLPIQLCGISVGDCTGNGRVYVGSPSNFRACSTFPGTLKSAQMQNETETLGLGSKAPEFSLSAANREGNFTLSGFLDNGPLILEFLRGTW